MSLKEDIKKVEGKWLENLYQNNKKAFRTMHLPSHDHTHHLRVWANTIQILKSFEELGEVISYESIEKLIIAVFFHDIGMAENIGPDHGHEGKEMCKKYMNENSSLKYDFDISEVLEAIQKHDNKNYLDDFERLKSINYTQYVLSIADDIDALGAIGVLRYFEIYFLRGIPTCMLPTNIISNLRNRYHIIKSAFKGSELEIQKNIENAYLFIDKFYNIMMEEITKGYNTNNIYNGNYGILNYYKELCIENSLTYSDFLEELKIRKPDELQLVYIKKLEEELIKKDIL